MWRMRNKGQIRLDSRDLRILDELQANNVITYRTLADRVALSPSACVARVKQLEDAGIITGYHAAIAIERVQSSFFMVAEIAMSSHNPNDLSRFDDWLLATPEIVEALRVNGQFDYLVRIMLPSPADWHPFAQRLLDPKYKVEKMISHVVMQELKRFTGYPLASRSARR